MRQKGRWLLVLGLGAAALAALLVLIPRDPHPVSPEEVPVSELGSSAEELPVPEEASAVVLRPGEPGLSPSREVLPPGYVQAGRLSYELDGRRVADEGYRLERLPSGEFVLLSEGTFSVRVVLVSVRVAFTQEVRLDAGLGPRLYRLETWGPFGLGSRHVSIAVDGDRAVVDSGGRREELAMPEGGAFFIGTLATYALLPPLHAAWANGDALLLQVVGGGPGPGGASALGSVEVVRGGTIEVDLDGRAELLERYEVRAGAFAGTLLARDLEFVAFVGQGERPFRVWRSDLSPRGFSIPPGGL